MSARVTLLHVQHVDPDDWTLLPLEECESPADYRYVWLHLPAKVSFCVHESQYGDAAAALHSLASQLEMFAHRPEAERVDLEDAHHDQPEAVGR